MFFEKGSLREEFLNATFLQRFSFCIFMRQTPTRTILFVKIVILILLNQLFKELLGNNWSCIPTKFNACTPSKKKTTAAGRSSQKSCFIALMQTQTTWGEFASLTNQHFIPLDLYIDTIVEFGDRKSHERYGSGSERLPKSMCGVGYLLTLSLVPFFKIKQLIRKTF